MAAPVNNEGIVISGIDAEGTEADTSVLEEQGVAFDPKQMHLDLTKNEKRRTTALLLAIQAYDKLIIKDAEMFEAVSREAQRSSGPVIKPATMNAMVEAAIQFDAFISGRLEQMMEPAAEETDEEEPEPEAAPVEKVNQWNCLQSSAK